MKARLDEQALTRRVAREFQDGSYVNLGYGIPSLASNYVPKGRKVTLHSENGALGFGAITPPEQADYDYTNASGQPVTVMSGMSLFDSAQSFGMIRGGHVDVAVLGALQVSEKGDLANWMRPGQKVGIVGGAMDLAVGAKRVIVAMQHTTKEGAPKIVVRCSYPLTAKECVDLIVTDIGVIEVTAAGLVLRELAPGWTVREVQAFTEPKLLVATDLKEIQG